jgi:drug/metabolite transporter (DMT)-like permease
LLGGLFLGAYALSISFGYLFIPVGAGTFVFYTFVVLTMVAYSAVVDHERLTFRLVLGQLLGLLGVLVITFTGIHSVTLAGVLLMAATGTSWGLYSGFGKKFHPSFSYTFNSFLVFGAFAIVATIAIWVLTGPVSRSIAVEDLGLALYMGMVSTALSYVVWNEMVKKIPAFLGGLVQLIVPVLAPIMGILFLREQITATLILGGGLVLIGIYTVQFRPANPVVASKL